MHLIRTLAFGLSIGLLLTMFSLTTSAPVVSGGYARVHFNIYGASGNLGDNTGIHHVLISFDNDDENCEEFTATSQTLLNVSENTYITRIRVYLTLNDNYADTTAQAQSRTRVAISLTDPDDVPTIDNRTLTLNNGATDNGDYFTVGYHTGEGYDTPSPYELENEPMREGNYYFSLYYEVYAPT